MTKQDILYFFKIHQEEMREKYSVVKIGIFGSYAKDNAGENSDIDVYAEFENKKFRNIAGVWNFLEEQLGKKIDLFYVHKNMRSSLKKQIESEVIYG